MVSKNDKTIERALLDLSAKALLDENLAEALRAYSLLCGRFEVGESLVLTDKVRGVILEAASIVGDDVTDVDRYVRTYRALNSKLGEQNNIPLVSKIRSTTNLFVSNYLSAGLSLLNS